MTSVYGTQVLICEETRQIVKDIFHTREVDMVYVKGRTRPVVIFEVMGTADSELAHDMMTVCSSLFLSRHKLTSNRH